MKFHFGGMPRGQLRFDIGSVSCGKGAERMTLRRWLVHHVGRRSWGVSFGHKLFIGVLHFDGTFEDSERIK